MAHTGPEECGLGQMEFRGFGGILLRADVFGMAEDPSVLLLHGAGQSRSVWNNAAEALVQAGRYVINLDLRGHGESDWAGDGRYDFEAMVQDVRAVLAQMASRPVIVGAALGGWLAAAAIGEEGGHLASGLVLADAPPELSGEETGRLAEALKQEAGRSDARPDWDPKLLELADVGIEAARISTAFSAVRLPVLFVRGALGDGASGAADSEADIGIEGAEYARLGASGPFGTYDREDAFNATLLDFLERRVPRFLPDYRQGSDARTLRDAMGCFATGVTVVTALGAEGEPVGLTANSFTSVSLEPPLLLVCIAKTSGSLKVIEAAEHFAVNVLHIGQQPISNTFARPGEDRFANAPWQRGQYDTPLICGALASFECARHSLHDGGDHVILVGRVERAKYDPRRDPLLYFKGRYRRLHFA